METQVSTPKWQAKFEKSFPGEIINIVNDVPKSETIQGSSNNEGFNIWLVIGLLAIAGITGYFIWKHDQEAKKQNIVTGLNYNQIRKL
ncbi:MAG: hypothetical protein IPL54_11690 [Chitinophagaceae bacterium]|nr:hypothetical protein [Chitinophagaceae bacterium]